MKGRQKRDALEALLEIEDSRFYSNERIKLIACFFDFGLSEASLVNAGVMRGGRRKRNATRGKEKEKSRANIELQNDIACMKCLCNDDVAF